MALNNEKKNINLINDIIIQAIIHGGDLGGPYCCNEEKLYNSIKQLIIQNNLEHDYEIAFLRIDKYVDKFPQIISRNKNVQQHNATLNQKDTIAKILTNKLCYCYCDNCEFRKWDKCQNTRCDDCHRKYQSWQLSEDTANSIVKQIIKEANNEK